MSFRHSTQLINSLISAPNKVGSVPLHGSVRSLIVSKELSATIYYKLAKQFRLAQYAPDINMHDYDAAFIDCRGIEISYPFSAGFERSADRPNMTIALVDENTCLPDDSANGSPGINLSNLELVTEAELDSAVLKLRLNASTRRKSTPANAGDNVKSSATNIVKDNAYQILQAFVRNSTDWIVVKDLDNRFVIASDRFLKSQNMSADEVIGKNDLEIGTSAELVLGNAEKNWKGYWQLDKEVIDSGKPSYTEHLVIHENALQQVREQVAKVPVTNTAGDIIGLMVCVTQVHSSRFNGKKMSEFTSRSSNNISPIVGILDNEKQKEKRKSLVKKQQSHSAFRRKNNFIATASHDLRQPLQAIGLFIESLEHQIIEEKQRSILKKMKQSSNDLTGLLNSILDVSKLDADAVIATKAHFCIAPLLKSLEDEFAASAKQKSIKLQVNHSDAFAYTDSLLLVRILRNLLSNAVKYTLEGGVSLLTEVQNESLLIHIKDSGPGIPEAQYLAIFDEYSQFDIQDTQPNFGMGLGLSIAKRLTDLLGFDISIDSKMGQGTHFTLTVPLGINAENQPDGKSGGSGSSGTSASVENNIENESNPALANSHKILIVEDNPIVLDATQEMLTCMNCDAYPASDIPEALEIINELDELPDLLVVDFQLADGVTGDTAIEKIREAAKADLPAIIVTGTTNSNLFRQASKAAYRVLNKPVNPETLLKTIDSAVREHRRSTQDATNHAPNGTTANETNNKANNVTNKAIRNSKLDSSPEPTDHTKDDLTDDLLPDPLLEM